MQDLKNKSSTPFFNAGIAMQSDWLVSLFCVLVTPVSRTVNTYL